MTTTKLTLNSLRHHARAHLGTLLGAAVGAAILIGALLVGDSVRESLKRMALLRLGETRAVLLSNDRLFRAELAGRLQDRLKRRTAPVLIFLGTASSEGGESRANRVQVLGVDERFANFAPDGGVAAGATAFEEEGVAINRPLATHLGVVVGDEVLLRLPKPSLLSREAPMAPEEDSSVALRLEISAIVEDSDLGRFSLQASQTPALNAFVPIALLQEKLETPGKANLMLIGGRDFENAAESSDDSETEMSSDVEDIVEGMSGEAARNELAVQYTQRQAAQNGSRPLKTSDATVSSGLRVVWMTLPVSNCSRKRGKV